MDQAEVFSRTPGALQIGARRFIILPLWPRDPLAVHSRMKELAKAKCVSPLDYALSHRHLDPAALEFAVSQALKIGAGGGIKPDPDAVADEYVSLEGVRYRVWYHARRAHPDLTLEEVASLVTMDNLFDVAADLDKALKLAGIDPNGHAPTTGLPS